MLRSRSTLAALGVTALGLALAATTVPAQSLDSATVAGFRWRTVGPANFMGRLSDVVGIPGPSKTIFVAAAGGGIWKTTNNGITWRPVFDDKRVISMGMLAIAPTDTQHGLGRHGRAELAQHHRARRRRLQVAPTAA